MNTRAKDSYCIRSVENALTLLEALADNESQNSLSQLSEQLGMTKASLFRLMATFESHGYVERKQESGEYKLGLAAFEVGQKLLSRMTLLQKARPLMNHLARQCDETVYLVVQRDKDALFMDMVDCEQKVKVVPLIGRRFPLNECASGRLLLAYSAPKYRNTSKQHLEIARELERCKNQGFAIDHNGLGDESSCVAAPLLGASSIEGCLAVVGPSFRLTGEKIERTILPALKAACTSISARIGNLNHVPENPPFSGLAT